jgi:predicted phosphoribosyltransferase
LAKTGSGLEAEDTLAVRRLLHDVRAGNVGGHEIGGELDAAEAEAERLAQGTDEHRLAQARHALEQGMTPGKDGDENVADHVLLADDHAATSVSIAAAVSRNSAAESASSAGAVPFLPYHTSLVVHLRNAHGSRDEK